ncbi:dihydrodipicolinate reductase [Rhodococcus sp. NPDC058514]|uniref:NAD(P)H-dependent amine dehydrogenase family protein n=1 Tax=unclassified Rhodococcus (in: high G+C Gram-positive bacteria) TaxID=192944 RepID=UPI0036632B66
MAYRVIQWATGGVGRAAIEGVLRHPELELVGCWVHSADKSGRDVGEIIGADPTGVIATDDAEAVYALDADCVVYAPLMPNKEEVARLLGSGKNVVTPLGWFRPTDRDAKMEATAREAGVTLHGTGIDPGGITDLFPLALSVMTSAATFVRAEEFSDMRGYNAPDVLRWVMCFGATPEEAGSGPMLKLLTGGFTQSLRLILDGMGFDPAAEIRTAQEVAVATAPIDTPMGVIEPGLVAAQRFQWDAVIGDTTVARVAVNWLMGEENLDPDWTLGPAGERFEVEIKGDPDQLVTFKGFQAARPEDGWDRNPGIVATANHCVNSIPYVCRAEPGIKGYLDLPLMAGRAHPDLAAKGDSARD